jgi:Cu-Zn family superoxide dismutase
MGNNTSFSYANDGKNAISIIKSDKVNGIILFHQCTVYDTVKVKFNLKGTPNRTHAIHVHEFGGATDDSCKSLGPHFNPYLTTHGSMKFQGPRHAGDLINNLTFDQKGNFVYEYEDELIRLIGDQDYSIIGRSIIIHDKADDLGQGGNEESLITGNAGDRIACSPISWCKKEHF